MKKTLLILLLSICSFAFSQNYHGYVPFPTDSGAFWNSIHGCYDGTYEIRGDTMINAKTYYKLRHYGKRYNSNASGCSFMNGYTTFDYYLGAFRNDSINRKVYIILADSTADSLFYDFDIQVGDTLSHSLKFSDYYNLSNAPAVVLYEDTVEYGGIWRRRFTLDQCSGNFADSVRLIEGIGSTESFFEPTVICPFEYGAGLICFFNDSKTIYPDSTTACQPIITSIDKKIYQEKSLQLFPNPTSGQVSLTLDRNLQSIEVYNLQGQKVQEINPQKRSWQLPEQSGLYLIRIQDEEGNVYIEKVIKE